MEGTIAEIRMFAGTFAPKNWAFCRGQVMPIASNTALFSIVGTTYGGNGTTTFALPDYQGRASIGAGQGPGLSEYVLGEKLGTESNVLSPVNMAAHSHAVTGTVSIGSNSEDPNRDSPTAAVPTLSGGPMLYSTTTDNSLMAPATQNLTTGLTGNAGPYSKLQPYLGMNYIICLYGIFPSRN